jgi:hypothetical protein
MLALPGVHGPDGVFKAWAADQSVVVRICPREIGGALDVLAARRTAQIRPSLVANYLGDCINVRVLA